MPSPEVLDFDALLAPISDDKPAGEDPRADPSPTSLYYATKDARSAARAAERQALTAEDGSGPAADWRPVVQNARKLLTGQAKDLEAAAYLAEGLLRLHGFAGLRDGFRLARELVERYWDDLYPLPDEDGVVTRVAPLTGLNGDDAEGTLIAPIAKVPLTEGDSTGPFAYHHYQQAGAVGQIVDEEARERRVQQGAVTLQLFERAVAETPAGFFSTLLEDLEQCQEEFARLGAALEERCGSSAPPASNIRSALEACRETVLSTARHKLQTAEPSEDGEAVEEAPTPEAPAGEGPGRPGGPLRRREEAFRQLLQVAEFFRRTEPHSPVSYALEQAVRWGRMSLPALLTELIPDDSSRQQFFRQVGIRPEGE
jgi:type VI secretion system protein ImpA